MKHGLMEAEDYGMIHKLKHESHRAMDEAHTLKVRQNQAFDNWIAGKQPFSGGEVTPRPYIIGGGEEMKRMVGLPFFHQDFKQLQRIDHYCRLKIGCVIHKLSEGGSTYAKWKLVGLHQGAIGCESFAELESISWKKGSAHGKTIHNIFVPLEFIIGNNCLGIEDEEVIDWTLRGWEIERDMLNAKIDRRKGKL